MAVEGDEPEEEPPLQSEEGTETGTAAPAPLPRRSLLACCTRNPPIDENEPIPPMTWPSSASGKGGVPETQCNILSRLLFTWVQPLFSRASYLHRRGAVLQESDLIPLPDIDGGGVISDEFERSWREFDAKQKQQDVAKEEELEGGVEKKKKKKKGKTKKASEKAELAKHLRHSLLSTMDRRRLVLAGLIKLLNTCLQFTFPLLLNAVLKFIEQSGSGQLDNPNRGYGLAALLFVAMAAKAVTENTYFHMAYRCGYHARVAVSTSVYNKALRLSGSLSGSDTSLGELVNLMQVDATKIEMFVPQIHVLWDGVVQIVGYMAILYTLIGWPCFVGLIVMIVAGPVQGKIMGKLFVLNRKMVKHTDSRVKATNEALQGIQCVKMYTWEDSFEAKVGGERSTELGFLKNVAYLRGFSRAYMSALPGIVAVVSFVAYAATGGAVAASTLFAALAAFDQLRFPLLFYPMALAQLAQAKVSVDRVANFLGTEERREGTGGRYVREGGGRSNETQEKGGAGADADTDGENKGEIVVEGTSVYWSDPTVPVAAGSKALDVTDATDRKSIATEQDDESAEVYPSAILTDLSFRVDSGQLCAVIGRVGCGKSSLCSAVLNEAILGEGLVSVKGTVAYAAQSAWILNATVRDNILFGLPMDRERYDAVVQACQLTHDMSILNDGDLTEIGERGINLSGGQKQRISIARAAYSDADVMILDDPLSALDPAVGQRLFEDCILGLMKGKARLLVTNQLQCLKRCDKVVSLGNGRIIEQGTYQDLMSAEDGEVRRLLNELKGSSESDKQTAADSEAPNDNGPKETPVEASKGSETAETKTKVAKEGKLTTKEERAAGAVKFSVYKKYLLSGGGLFRFAIVYFGFILCAGTELLKNIWISLWTADSSYQDLSLGFYMGIYAFTAVALGVFTFFRSFFLARFGVEASENLHNKLLSSVLRAPQSFFDTTPIGRIISRFSKDMHSIDQELSDYFDFFLYCSLVVVVSLGTITFATPWFGVAILPLMFVYVRVLNYFRDVSRETKRLDSISRSPVFAHFSETLGGLSTIRAYEQPARFVQDFLGKVDLNTKAYYCNKAADRWLSVRLELIGSLIAGLAAVFAIGTAISQAASGARDDSNFASLAGLSLTYAISVTSLLNWCVRSFAQLEAGMNATERVLFYTEDIPQEAPRTAEELEKKASNGPSPPSDPSAFAVVASGGKAVHPAPEWPTKGAMLLNNLVMRYRPETPIVLKGLSVSIAGGERIGVVGRTGSGKSSLLLSLMRIVEPELTGDRENYVPPITIDGVDILRLGITNLRSKLGIIPQNPVLFSGTFRSNLDPFDEYSDDQIWTALGGCGMKDVVEQTPGGLDGQVAEYGENLSQGQRQLLCLGRALLKQCQILLLDEATSSVDFETDREIQHTLRSAFAGSTVLTIAHRTNTIMDSDKILVMKDGIAEEFDSPKELLRDDSSLFSEIVRHAEAEENH